jgi:hypothetical protein
MAGRKSSAYSGETVFHSAIEHWWNSKRRNKTGKGKSQGGTRDTNLRGDTMDGFRDVIRAQLIEVGVDPADIFSSSQFSALPSNLPSYFRASKNWDIIVCKNSLFKTLNGNSASAERKPTLIAAIEFKSQEGSIGNNQNNRIEESIGSATDFWASYENGNFARLQPRPWLGYLFVGRYAEKELSGRVEIKQPHFYTDPVFEPENSEDRLSGVKYRGPSYATRYRIFLERMIAKKYYDGAAFIATNEAIFGLPHNYMCVFNELSGERFMDGLLRHVRAYYPD